MEWPRGWTPTGSTRARLHKLHQEVQSNETSPNQRKNKSEKLCADLTDNRDEDDEVRVYATDCHLPIHNDRIARQDRIMRTRRNAHLPHCKLTDYGRREEYLP